MAGQQPPLTLARQFGMVSGIIKFGLGIKNFFKQRAAEKHQKGTELRNAYLSGKYIAKGGRDFSNFATAINTAASLQTSTDRNAQNKGHDLEKRIFDQLENNR